MAKIDVGERTREQMAHRVDESMSRRDLGRFVAFAGLAGLAPAATIASSATSRKLARHTLAAQEAPRGGSLIVARSGDAGTLDPQYAFNGLSLHPLYSVYDTLTAVNPETQKVEGVLAERWDISDDGLEYTLHLRQGSISTTGPRSTLTP